MIQDDSERGYTISTCNPPCQLYPCPNCTDKWPDRYPQYYLNCHWGMCGGCAVVGLPIWKGPGYCKWCHSSEKLPIIYNKKIDDWGSELYHKECWMEIDADNQLIISLKRWIQLIKLQKYCYHLLYEKMYDYQGTQVSRMCIKDIQTIKSSYNA